MSPMTDSEKLHKLVSALNCSLCINSEDNEFSGILPILGEIGYTVSSQGYVISTDFEIVYDLLSYNEHGLENDEVALLSEKIVPYWKFTKEGYNNLFINRELNDISYHDMREARDFLLTFLTTFNPLTLRYCIERARRLSPLMGYQGFSADAEDEIYWEARERVAEYARKAHCGLANSVKGVSCFTSSKKLAYMTDGVWASFQPEEFRRREALAHLVNFFARMNGRRV